MDLLKLGPEKKVEATVSYRGTIQVGFVPHPPASGTYERQVTTFSFRDNGKEKEKDVYDRDFVDLKMGQRVILTLQRWVFGNYSVRKVEPC